VFTVLEQIVTERAPQGGGPAREVVEREMTKYSYLMLTLDTLSRPPDTNEAPMLGYNKHPVRILLLNPSLL
jgi:hypothetical protein